MPEPGIDIFALCLTEVIPNLLSNGRLEDFLDLTQLNQNALDSRVIKLTGALPLTFVSGPFVLEPSNMTVGALQHRVELAGIPFLTLASFEPRDENLNGIKERCFTL